MKMKAFGDRILAVMIDRPDGYKKTDSGIFIADKDGDVSGIKPRWFQIASVGERINWVKEGEYVLVAHGRWSNKIKTGDPEFPEVWLLDNDEIMAASDDKPF